MSGAQPKLVEMVGFSCDVWASPGTELVARATGVRVDRAHAYLSRLLGFSPAVRVLVLDRPGWRTHATHPTPGMPHRVDDRTIATPGADRDYSWAVVPPQEKSDPVAHQLLRDLHGTPHGGYDLSDFFDLLVVHQLAHLFHRQARRRFPRRWLAELFGSLCLDAYVTHREPRALGTLVALPPAVVAAGRSEPPPHTTLKDFELLRDEVGPLNYGWYQCHLHCAARRVLRRTGDATVHRFWELLPILPPDTPDDVLLPILDAVHPEVGRTLREWPNAS